jgi:hypothetical protein
MKRGVAINRVLLLQFEEFEFMITMIVTYETRFTFLLCFCTTGVVVSTSGFGDSSYPRGPRFDFWVPHTFLPCLRL